MSIFLHTSQRGALRALAGQGIFAVECHAQLRDLLLNRLGPEHAALLAEPQHDPERRSVDWYAEGEGTALPLSRLSPEEAEALKVKAGALAREIQALAQQLESEGHNAALSGQLLSLALRHPDDSDLWSVDGRPVLTNWGFAPGAVGARPQDLTRLGAFAPKPSPVTPEPPAAVPPVAAPPARGCLLSPGWLLPLFLLLLLLWLLASILGLLPSPLPSGCFRDEQARQAVDEAQARRAALEEELMRLREQLGLRAQLCKPEPPKAPEPPIATEPAAEPEPKPEPRMVEPFFGETPPEPEPVPAPKAEAKPEPKPAPKPEPKPEPKPKPRKGEDLKIPEDAASKKDLSFLEGCWVSETGLFSHPRNEPIIAEYCFDKKGQGRRFVRERNGQVCSGPAQAQFEGSRLTFEAGDARCPRGGQYVPQQVECRGNNTSTQCSGHEMGGKNLRWKARFKRK